MTGPWSQAALEAARSSTGLVRLEVNDCRKVCDISPIAALRRLEELHLCNDGDIKPLEDLGDLETFLFYESTNILDGDLWVLTRLPKLKKVAFMERAHYSHNRAQLPTR